MLERFSDDWDGPDPDYPRPPPVPIPSDRRSITREEPQVGVEWIGAEQQGGGFVPPDFEWTSNPKQIQEDLGGG